jgi:uncharacterized tellurite resistance protein B-like protein
MVCLTEERSSRYVLAVLELLGEKMHMSSRDFILDLGKLLIAAAWADGKLSTEEINVLKDLLFRIDDLSGEDWAVLKMYMESPVSADEQTELAERVTGAMRTDSDKELVLSTLERLFKADGTVTGEEQALLDRLRSEVGSTDTGLFAGLSRALKGKLSVRGSGTSALREEARDDYLRNPVYYELSRRLREAGRSFGRSEAETRKLCLTVALLCQVAAEDGKVSSSEQQAMTSVLTGDMDLSAAQAELLIAIGCDRAARDFDEFRVALAFFESTTVEERRELLSTLFRIADATDRTSHEEMEEIRRLSIILKLPHHDYIEAKRTVVGLGK